MEKQEKNQKLIKKIIIVLAVIIACFFANKVYAISIPNIIPSEETILDTLTIVIGGTFGIIVTIIRYILLIAITLIESFLPIGIFNIDNILFGKITFLNLDYAIRPQNFSNLFSGFSGIAYAYYLVVFSMQFVILLYGIIRLIVSSTDPSRKAKAKEFLIGWVKGIFVMFGLLFVAFSIIFINWMMVNALKNSISGLSSSGLNSFTNVLRAEASKPDMNLKSNMALVMYAILKAQTLTLIYYYLARAIRIFFYLLLAPFVSISVTAAASGLSKYNLKTWFTKFIALVFINSVHVFIYISLIGTLFETFDSFNVKRAGVLGFLSNVVPLVLLMIGTMQFLFYAEKFFKKYFPSSTSQTDVGIVMGMATAGINKLKSFAKNVNKVASNYSEKGIRNEIGRTEKIEENTQIQPARINAENKEQQGKHGKLEERRRELNLSDIIVEDTHQNTEPVKKGFIKAVWDSFDDELKAQKKSKDKFKDFIKKRKKEKTKLPKRILKRATSALGTGMVYTLLQANTAGNITLESARETKKLFAETGSASKKATNKYINSRKSKTYISPVLHTRYKKAENYDKNIIRFAVEQAKLSERLSKLNGFDFDLTTENGRENMEAYNRMIIQKGKEELEKEYKDAKKELIKYLSKEKGINQKIAAELVEDVIKKVEGNKNILISELNKQEIDLITTHTNMVQHEMITEFNEYSKKLKDALYLDDKYTEDKAVKDATQELSHYNRVIRYIESIEGGFTEEQLPSVDFENEKKLREIIDEIERKG